MLDKEFPTTHSVPASAEKAAQADESTPDPDTLYEFGCFLLDPSERSLTCNGQPVALTPKAFDTLCVLVENSGRLVSKDQLLDRIWPKTYVEEKTLAQNVFTLRKALGPDPSGKNYIETIPKQGYRFVSGVQRIPRASVQPVGSETILPIDADIDRNGVGASNGRHLDADSFVTAIPRVKGQPRAQLARFPVRRKQLLFAGVLLVGIAASLFFGRKFIGGRPASSNLLFEKVQVTRLTSTGDVGPMGMSPDGKYVAYAKRGAGAQSLVVRQTESSSSLELLPPETVGYVGVTFAPDGNSIFYVSFAYGASQASVYRIPVLGGTPQRIADDADSRVTVSPDGTKIAFVRSVPGRTDRQMVIASANGGSERVLATQSSEPMFSFQGPAWSPDGTTIATSTASPRTGLQGVDILLVNAESGAVTRFGSKQWRWVGQLAWLPDGRELLATAAAADDPAMMSEQIWILSYPSGEARRITANVNGHLGIGISFDRSKIASIVSDRTAALWVAENSDPASAKLVTRVAGDRLWSNLGLSWLPDGRLLYSSRASGAAELWTMNADGTGQKQITFDGGLNITPAATHDGRFFVYMTQRNGQRQIWRVNADGSNAKQLTQTSGSNSPRITPDGKWVVYTEVADNKPSLFKVSIDGGEPVKLGSFNALYPAPSPDGKYVACYIVTPDNKRRLSIISFPDAKVVTQFDMYMEYDLPIIKWTPDGRSLLYAMSRNGVSNIWSQPVKGGAPKQITNWDSDEIFRFDWSRDGRLAVERGTFVNDIVLIQPQQ